MSFNTLSKPVKAIIYTIIVLSAIGFLIFLLWGFGAFDRDTANAKFFQLFGKYADDTACTSI